jgi:hypothetical protein
MQWKLCFAQRLNRQGGCYNDPKTPVIGLEVITNEPRSVAFFENLLIRFSISGRVVVKT